MNRWRGRVIVAASVGAALLGVFAWGLTAAAISEGTFRDEFRVIGFSGDDGTVSWSGPWYEIGESDGAAAGAVMVKVTSGCVADACIEIGKKTDSDGFGMGRRADLSGATSAVLTFSYQRKLSPKVGTGIRVLASATGTSPWTELAYYSLDAGDSSLVHEVLSLDGLIGAWTEIRLVIDGDVGTGRMNIDDVMIVVTDSGTPTVTTTTTTTVPVTTTTTTVPVTTTTTTLGAGETTTTTTVPVTTTTTTLGAGETTTTTTVPVTTTTTTIPDPPLLVAGLAPAPPSSSEAAFEATGAGRAPLERVMSSLMTSVEVIGSPALSSVALAGLVVWLTLRGFEGLPEDGGKGRWRRRAPRGRPGP